MLTTLLRPSRGSALVAGRNVVDDPLGVRRQIGLVFQETTLDLDLTAEENLRFAARLYGLSRSETAARTAEALELFGLSDRGKERVRGFSGGMRRALDLARGVLHRPSILFLDEPTLGLDPGQRRRIWVFLRRLCDEGGTTLFLTTHYLEEADDCDRVAIVEKGSVIALETPTKLKQKLGRESIELTGAPTDELVARVRELTGIEPLRTGDGVSVIVADVETVLPKLLPLTQEGVQMRVTRPTLEDVFVSLTEGAR